MSKLRRDLRVAMAGACAGLFSVSVFLLGYRVVAFYDYQAFREEHGYRTPYLGVEDLWWIPVVVWHVVLSTGASLLVHRYLASGRASTFLRWQVIGAVMLVAWGLTVFIGISIDCLMAGNTQPVDQTLSMVKLMPVAQFVAAIFASNVLYGSAIQAASMADREAERDKD